MTDAEYKTNEEYKKKKKKKAFSFVAFIVAVILVVFLLVYFRDWLFQLVNGTLDQIAEAENVIS